jgi:hypothetical protein
MTHICHDEYTLKYKECVLSYRYRVDMENHTGFNVQIILYNSCQIGVSIDRIGHFVFRGWDAILGMKNAIYVGEKLSIPQTDAMGMIKFFEWFYHTDMPICYRIEAWEKYLTS